MKILLTAIGSMSACCAIRQLTQAGHEIYGCDIYPAEWHYESTLCQDVFKAPLATQKDEYIQFLLNICTQYNISAIIPLTDLEIDVINDYRQLFNNKNIILCMQDRKVLEYARNKYNLYTLFKNDNIVPSIKTCLLVNTSINDIQYPCIAKPYNGRSSEGFIIADDQSQLMQIKHPENYIIQEKVNGSVFTIDYIRDRNTSTDVSIAREELLRTKNGAGLTVKITQDSTLNKLVSYIGNTLNIHGCINMEFIKSNNTYYLIDINPRFSAGVAFSVFLGYDMINNHLNCFFNIPIDKPIAISETLMTKRYQEEILPQK